MTAEKTTWVFVDLREFPKPDSIRTFGNLTKMAETEEVMVGGERLSPRKLTYRMAKTGHWKTENHLISRVPFLTSKNRK